MAINESDRGPCLVVLAAGAGSRYGGLKQLAPMGPSGEALVEYTVFDAVRAGFSRAILVVRPDTEGAFREKFRAGMAGRVPIAFAHQTLEDVPCEISVPQGRARPWGTGHAVLAAEDEIDGPFAVVNADDYYGRESFVMLANFLKHISLREPLELAVIGFEVAQTLTDTGPVSRALCRLDAEGGLEEIVELKEVWRRGDRVLYRDSDGGERPLRSDEVVSMNMWGFVPELLADLRRQFAGFLQRAGRGNDAEFLLPDAVQHLLRQGRARVAVLPSADRWCGITFRDDHKSAAAVISGLVDQGRYPEELWA